MSCRYAMLFRHTKGTANRRGISSSVVAWLFFLGVYVVSASVVAEEDLVWRLGKIDGSSGDFQLRYDAWEYGQAPRLIGHPGMMGDYTFTYHVANPEGDPSPEAPNGLSTVMQRQWMQEQEVVTGLKLVWDETEAGQRKLSFRIMNFRNMLGMTGGIDLLLPGGGKKVFSLPLVDKDATPLELNAIFPVTAGRNEALLRITSLAKHFRFQFDAITLYMTDEKEALTPVLNGDFDAFSAIYHPGQDVKLSLIPYNFPPEGDMVDWALTDAFGQKKNAGEVHLANAAATIHLPSSARGWFSIECRLRSNPDGVFRASYAVTEPVQEEYIDDSRFGCHAFIGDGYRMRYWPQRQELKMRRAFLGGAKWARYHALSWEIREPTKGTFDWTHLDDKLSVAEKYKIRPLINVYGTPEWASTSTDQSLNVCGDKRYRSYPPRDWNDWADFLVALVSHCKGRCSWYEIWNEPGTLSAFWGNGSAEDYARLLKTGYGAAKRADPDCVILSGAPLSPPYFFENVIRANNDQPFFDVMSAHYLGNIEKDSDTYFSWKSSLSKMGHDLPIVNTEESWKKFSDSEMGFAGAILRTYIHEAAQGIHKTFGFELFDDNSPLRYSLFNLDEHPYPAFAAFRTMTHRLERATFVCDLTNAQYEAYLFDRQGIPVLAFWSDKGMNAVMNLGGTNATWIDIMDQETPLTSDNGTFRVPMSSYPAFLEGGDMEQMRHVGEIRKALPERLSLAPGSVVERRFRLDESVTALRLALPEKWLGEITPAGLMIETPEDAPEGVYDAGIHLAVMGKNHEIPFQVDLFRGGLGENLIQNGNFHEEGRNWFFSPENVNYSFLPAGGKNGSSALQVSGPVHFGPSGRIKVREGERYAVVIEAKGEGGSFGGVYTVLNKEQTVIFPDKPGINTVSANLCGEWGRYSGVISITQPEAEYMSFAIVANYNNKENSNVYFGNVMVVRLTDTFSVNKVVYSGQYSMRMNQAATPEVNGNPDDWTREATMDVGSRADVIGTEKVSWSGKSELSASCQVMMDSEYIYLLFVVKDDIVETVSQNLADSWMYDSIQFAFDPTLEGRDFTEILIARDASGQTRAYKYANFWTPEIPEGVTRQGEMKSVQAVSSLTEDGIVYEVRIPLIEVYPLRKESASFGFSWLVNDNDGKGRKYIQWSSGIGGTKDASQFGLMLCRDADKN